MLKYIYIFFFTFPFLLSCRESDPIEKIATFQFRNLYQGKQSLTPTQMESLRNANPSCYTIRKDYQKMFNKLNALEVVNNNSLQLQNLKFEFPQDDKQLANKSYEYCRVFFDQSSGHRKLEVKVKGEILQISILNDLPSLSYGYADIIEGGEKEVLILSWYDLTNGRNYDLDIYEVK